MDLLRTLRDAIVRNRDVTPDAETDIKRKQAVDELYDLLLKSNGAVVVCSVPDSYSDDNPEGVTRTTVFGLTAQVAASLCGGMLNTPELAKVFHIAAACLQQQVRRQLDIPSSQTTDIDHFLAAHYDLLVHSPVMIVIGKAPDADRAFCCSTHDPEQLVDALTSVGVGAPHMRQAILKAADKLQAVQAVEANPLASTDAGTINPN